MTAIDRTNKWLADMSDLHCPAYQPAEIQIVSDLLVEIDRLRSEGSYFRNQWVEDEVAKVHQEASRQTARECAEIAEVLSNGYKPESWAKQAVFAVVESIRGRYGLEATQ